ncbi:hypothetical protein ACFLQ7_00055 [Actinomycetota bacterium]|jgi:hypothetical protein
MTDDRTDTTSASDATDEFGGDGGSRSDTMEPCPMCRMTVRRSELAVHLAHAHNIGPSGSNKRKGQRGGRDRR